MGGSRGVAGSDTTLPLTVMCAAFGLHPPQRAEVAGAIVPRGPARGPHAHGSQEQASDGGTDFPISSPHQPEN